MVPSQPRLAKAEYYEWHLKALREPKSEIVSPWVTKKNPPPVPEQ